MRRLGTPFIPVVGYDRWEDPVYFNSLLTLSNHCSKFNIRLEEYAFEDMLEGEHFLETLDSIISSLNLETRECGVILDFGDVTNKSIIDISENLKRAIGLISKFKFNFNFISISGCSLTTIINNMVPEKDSENTILRKEMIAWQAYIKNEDGAPEIIYGDYGVVPPNSSTDIIAPDANGKIRYTIDKNYFIARGHSRRTGNKGEQMYDLASRVIDSGYFMGENFSWGDKRIASCANKEFKGNPGQWVSIDTNHHIKFVVQEIHEFNQLQKAKEYSYS